jgi:hypothetical protein
MPTSKMATDSTDHEESFPEESRDVFVQYPAHTPLPLSTLRCLVEREGKMVAIRVTSDYKDRSRR